MVATAAAVNHHPGGLFFRPFFSAADGWRAPAVLTGYKPGTSPQNYFFLLRLLPPERGEQTRARDRPNPQTRVKSAAAYYARAIWPNPTQGLQGARTRKGRFLTLCALFSAALYNYTPGRKISPQRAKKEGAFWRSLFLCAAAFMLRPA